MALKPIDTTKIQFEYSTLYWGGIITFLCAALYYFVVAKVYNNPVDLKDITAILTCGLVSTTLVYHAKNLRLNYEVNKEKIEFDKAKYEEEKQAKLKEAAKAKKLYAFQVSALWFKPDMATHVELSRKFLREHHAKLEAHQPISEFVEALEKDIEARKAVTCILNYFENLSLLIKNDLVEEDAIKNCFKTLFVDYHKALRKYIDEIQKGSKRFLMNYEEIANEWSVS